jgi:hypothetical protein
LAAEQFEPHFLPHGKMLVRLILFPLQLTTAYLLLYNLRIPPIRKISKERTRGKQLTKIKNYDIIYIDKTKGREKL